MKLKDLIVLLAVILIVLMLIIPLPNFILSFLIIINISLALIVLLVAMNMKEPLEFSILPSLLLLLTLFRLGLNVSTTRAILGKGDAGVVIETFGNFVIGGNAIVGFVVFLILIIIQFVVITKGAERVAEVAARFTLDAMPGKQMSIDADLNAGLINEKEAKGRREKIAKEADFYGAMDGASKFVKGDAIAGIIIVMINMIVGMVIGVVQLGMSLGDSTHTYTLLTVGDGLVSQIPALLISTATGIIVTRAASDGNLGQDITKQILAYPTMLYIAGGVILLLGFTPIGFLITVPVAILLCVGGYFLSLNQAKPEVNEEELAADIEEEKIKSPESVVDLLETDPIEFEFGYALVPLADANQGGDLLDRIVMIRRQLAIELGMVIPVVRIRDNIQLEPNSYRLKIKGSEIARGSLLLDHYLAMSPGEDDPNIVGVDTVEPAFGLPAKWIGEDMKEQAELAGYTVVDPPSVVSTHITELLKRHCHELLGRKETKQLIEHLKQSDETLVNEVTPEPLSIGEVQKVLVNLLRENLSIRNLPVIFEVLADVATMTKDTDLLTEYVRQGLSRQISHQYVRNNLLKVLTLDPAFEETITESIQRTEHGNYLALNPEMTQRFIEQMAQIIERQSDIDQEPVLLCSPAVRLHVKQLISRSLPQVAVLSYNELEPTIEIQSIGVVNGA
ncbi:flagellar biosynthesis protein FlhA [Pullulanibacillus pueri]|uniref:Flagellar biosynthesis protein FlhA n=1 Tax=Pullulanibacillus pueri TaxID=1437324 RepID=A0A8J2ZX15_9BACL|nr:flagellar biosynthesis protein FlhA [Pullulanibacillus pueri]MBM7682494.1 flagellar biosynthesis protein FlhA [Pullulanibacillus pueri]GGH82174.1 flagellar biosynthesis protein FlhA [Pullulanibacillus pueri]